MNNKLASVPLSAAIPAAVTGVASGEGRKMLESCVTIRSSLSQLLAGNANTESTDADLTARLRHRSGAVVGAQIGNLLEYVELYCLASVRGAFRVTAHGKTGALWFDAGQLVHAQVGTATGEAAALEILSWGSGSLSPSSAPFPLRASIDMPWQSLILQAEAWRDGAS